MRMGQGTRARAGQGRAAKNLEPAACLARSLASVARWQESVCRILEWDLGNERSKIWFHYGYGLHTHTLCSLGLGLGLGLHLDGWTDGRGRQGKREGSK